MATEEEPWSGPNAYVLLDEPDLAAHRTKIADHQVAVGVRRDEIELLDQAAGIAALVDRADIRRMVMATQAAMMLGAAALAAIALFGEVAE